MWSFREGLGLLVETLRERLRTRPLTGVAVRAVTPDSGPEKWQVLAEGRDAWAADAVVLTCPAYQQAALLAGLDAKLADQIGGIAYNRVAVVAVGYRSADVPVSTEGFGYLSPQRCRRDVLGVQWCSSIFPGRAPPGCVLLRAMCGGWHRPEIVDWDDERLLQAVRAELAQTMHIQAPPVFHHVVRWHRAIPQYHLGHLDRVAAIERRASGHAGLFLGGNAYHGVALNDCVEQAGVLAERVAVWLNNQGV
jgi:oxygen-dependent protoporphyrinogen oxidase